LKLDEPTEPSLPLEIDVLSTPEHANVANPVISPDLGFQNTENTPIEGCESEVENYNTGIAASINAAEPQSELPLPVDDATALPTAPNVGLGQQNVVSRPTTKRERRRASQQARRMR